MRRQSRKNAILRLCGLAFLLSISSASLGSAFFQGPQAYNSGGWNATSMAVADVNRDGQLDMIVANYCLDAACHTNSHGVLGVLLGNGDGTFKAAGRYESGGESAQSVAVADLNGDGFLDLAVAHLCSDSTCSSNAVVGVLFGNGDGTFQLAHSYSSGGYEANSIAAGDVNGDGRPDLLVANACFTSENCRSIGGARGAVGVLLGKPDGTFEPARDYDSGGNKAVSVVVGDVNQDGKADLLALNMCSREDCGPSAVVTLLGNGDGTFQSAMISGLGESQSSSLTIADVNGDNKVDLLAGDSSTVRVSLGNGDGTFQPSVHYDTGAVYVETITVGDVNGDGKSDLLTGSRCEVGSCVHGVITVLLGNGDGTFQRPKIFSSYGKVANSIVLADVNSDSRLDLLVTNLGAVASHGRGDGSAVVFLNKSRTLTTTSLVSNPNPSIQGQAVTLTASVSSASHLTPTGRVTFKNGEMLLRTVNLSGTTATLITKTLPAGTLSVTATYDGDTESAKSTSSPLTQVVSPARELGSLHPVAIEAALPRRRPARLSFSG